MEITKTIVVADKKARLALRPKKGNMVVQRDVRERFVFDGEVWRFWMPGTKRHWKESGKPSHPQPLPKGGEPGNEAVQKKRNLTWIVIAAIFALGIIGTLLISNT